jgi:hypothetical protein
VEARTTRLAKNEALFREVNERVADVTQSFAKGLDLGNEVDGFVCECSDPLCLERVGPLTVEEYEAVRRDARRFIIAPNHQAPDVESVVEKQQRYWIVKKHEGIPSEVARERDPRS